MRYPARLIRALSRADDDPEAFCRIALHHVTGIHLYTLNQAQPVLEMFSRIFG